MKSTISTKILYIATLFTVACTAINPAITFAATIPSNQLPSLPTLSTQIQPVGSIGDTTATFSGSFNLTTGTNALVWFQYGTSLTSLTSSTTPTVKTGTSGTFSAQVSNLTPGTTYYVRSYASSNGAGTVYSNIAVQFSTTGSTLSTINTLPPTSITTTSATLNAFIQPATSGLVLVFKWGPQGTLSNTLTYGTLTATSGQKSITLSGLTPNTHYEYKACLRNGHQETCSPVSVVFKTLTSTQTTYECNDGIDNDSDGYTDYPQDSGCSSSTDDSEYASTGGGSHDEPNATTNSATSIDDEEATLNGEIESGDDDVYRVWFEWGEDDNDLDNDEEVDEDEYDGSDSTFDVELAIDNLDEDTKYYFRVCAENSYGEDCGSIRSFTTDDNSNNNNNDNNEYVHESPQVIPRVIYKTTTVGSTSSKVMLSIDTRFDNAYSGDTIDYVINYKNISGYTLSHSILHVEFPKEVTFRRASEGRYNEKDHTLTLDLGTLAKGEHDEITVSVRAESSLRSRSEVVTKATLAFTLPNSAQDNAIAYAITKVSDSRVGSSGSVLAGTALFGGDGFLPDSLIEWLILTILIAILIIGFRQYRHKTA